MDDVAGSDGVVYRLIYRSRNVIPEPERQAELGRLFSAARSHNKEQRITGALLLLGDCFVQTLEGDEAQVQALLARIRADARHEALEVLETGLVDGRVFGRWSMAKVADEQDQPDLPLIARVKGITSAAPRGDSTPDQEAVLQVMREAARGRQPV